MQAFANVTGLQCSVLHDVMDNFCVVLESTTEICSELVNSANLILEMKIFCTLTISAS